MYLIWFRGTLALALMFVAKKYNIFLGVRVLFYIAVKFNEAGKNTQTI